jgi:molybdopterin/thiamine biosynthesis adenylyltransferase
MECAAEAGRITFHTPVAFIDDIPDFRNYDAVLSVGFAANIDLPWTVVNSNGWLARVSSGTTNLPSDMGQYNPVAALAAACLGVAEVFKRLLRVRESRGHLIDGLSFSLHTFQAGVSDFGPPLPGNLPLDLLLVGAGAIGNGVVHLLSLLQVSGRIWIVDRQTFQEENLGTCLLIGPSDIGRAKAMVALKALERRLAGKGFVEDIVEFGNRLGKEVPYPKVVLTGLDNIDARHAIQDLWPDLIIDGAIGDFSCQVSRHPWGEDTACLKCLFRHLPGKSTEHVVSKATGLTENRAEQMHEFVSKEDVTKAPADKKNWLQARIGKQICSVVQEGIAQQISNEEQKEGFEPSVPFVACLSSCMIVAELVKSIYGWPSSLESRFQFDVLHGPALGQELPQRRRQDCVCTTRNRNIETIRLRRNVDA